MSAGSTGADLRALDAGSRRIAQTVFDRPVALVAGAGTGKTAALVSRIVSWCMGPGWGRAGPDSAAGATADPEAVASHTLRRVVAITFTEAAAAEMAERVAEAFARLARDETPVGLLREGLPPPGERRTRARALLTALDHLTVRTIHAYCRRILAAHPMEAGLRPGFEVDADGTISAETVREVVEERLRAAYRDEPAGALLALAGAGIGPPEIEAELRELVAEGVPPPALADDPFDPERIARLQADLRAALRAFRESGGDRLANVSRRSASALSTLEAVGGAETLCELEPPASTEALAEWTARLGRAWPETPRKRLREYARGRYGKEELRCLDGAQTVLAERAAELDRALRHVLALDPVLLERARALLHPLLEEVQRRLRARGAETFPALLSDARDLLFGHPEVCDLERRRIDQLLVDEFQDTDRLQCEILQRIALEGPEDARPGLFLVGDPKQSIYGFRSADLAAYEGFLARVEKAGGMSCRLGVSFRSAPPILAEVERSLEPVMTHRPGVQAAFEPLVACEALAQSPGFASGRFAPIERWTPCGLDPEERQPLRTTVARAAASIEAEALARDLCALRREHGVAWRDIGVLFRTAGELDVYLGALRDAGVPYAAVREQGYYRRREVIEAAALVRCILDPGDHLALVSLLRSAWVGVPDAAWLPLWSRGFPQHSSGLHGPSERRLAALREIISAAAEELPSGVPGLERVRGWERSLLAAVESIAELRRSFRADPPDVFVERLRTLFLVEPAEAARYLGAWRLANLDRFFRRLLHDLEEGRDPHATLRSLRSAVTGAREAEDARPPEAQGDAVQVLTMHAAKGLDFRHVYLMQLHKGSGSRARARAEEVDGRFEYSLLGACTPGFDRVRRRQQQVEEAERARTLYVAMTRAKERLVISGLPPAFAGSAGRARESHAQLLESRRGAAPDLRELASALARDGGDVRDEDGVRFVFPGLRAPEEAADGAPAPPAGGGLPDAAAVREASETLLRHRRAAAAHMARPFRSVASEAAPDGGLAARARGSVEAEIARRAGTAIHRVLETFDLEADAEEEIARQRARLPALLAPHLAPEALEPALVRARDLLDRLARGPLLERLRSLAPGIIARELPVLLPAAAADADAGPGAGTGAGAGPVGFTAGAIDLLYRDPEDGRFVVADYKTDAVEGAEALAGRAALYARQADTYVRAVRGALALAYDPRSELWFLHAGRIQRA